jgi:uncharacterized protein
MERAAKITAEIVRNGYDDAIASNRPALRDLWKEMRHRPMFGHEAEEQIMALDDKTRTELEAAAFRRLVEHLRSRTDVQNIDMMNLAGFCRNCLSNWMKDAADAKGVPMTKDESREAIYGMRFEEWKAKYQKESSAEQKAAFQKASEKH